MVVVVISGLMLKLKIDARVSVRKVKEEARWRLDCCVEGAERNRRILVRLRALLPSVLEAVS
jgi:hypothetical protein